jgi:hypothetical protein
VLERERGERREERRERGPEFKSSQREKEIGSEIGGNGLC